MKRKVKHLAVYAVSAFIFAFTFGLSFEKNANDDWSIGISSAIGQSGGESGGGESGGSNCHYNLGHSYNLIVGGEMVATTLSLGSFVVSAGHTITVNGKVITVGSNYSVGQTVNVTATDYICKKCIFGTTWCGNCNSSDDNRNILPCG